MKAKRRSAGAEGQYVNWLLAILVIAILLALLVPSVSAGWDWRRPITITDAGTDLTYLVTLSSGQYGNMNDDGSDLRFTDGGNNVKYNYWIEKWDKTGESKIWVKVPGDPSGTPPIYMWYGNSEASSESNGAATFTFFDDFDNFDNWEEKLFRSSGAQATISVTDSKLRIVSAGYNREGACTKAVQLSQGQKFEAKVVTRSGGVNGANIVQVLYQGSQDNLYENIPYAGGDYKVWKRVAGTDTNIYPGSGDGIGVTCYPYAEYRTTDYLHFGARSCGEKKYDDSPWDNTNFKLGFYSYPKGTIEIDWVFVREYASTEPGTTVGAQGGTGGGAPVPELPSVILFSVGFIVLAGYVLLRRREKKKVK